MSFFPVARRIDTYMGVLGDGNGVRRIKLTDKVIVELFERGSGVIVQAILRSHTATTVDGINETDLPAEGTIVWLIPDSDRAPNMLRVITDLLP